MSLENCSVQFHKIRDFNEIDRLYLYINLNANDDDDDAVARTSIQLQLLSKFFIDSGFCHNYLHTPVVLNCYHTLDFKAIENFYCMKCSTVIYA